MTDTSGSTPGTPSAVHVAAEGVTYAYPDRVVLDAVDLVAAAGDRIGVVGENGAGKTTLLRVLAGELVPQAGTVRRAGRTAVVAQELEVEPDATVGTLTAHALTAVRQAAAELDAVVEGFDHERGDLGALAAAIAAVEQLAAWDVDRRVDEALTRFSATRDPAARLDELSVGERYRVRLACRIAERADILLLDEPTNHLDTAGIEYLTAQLRDWPGVVVIVTHDRRLLDDVMTAILDLDPSMDGRPVLYGATRYATYRFMKNQSLRRWRARYAGERKRALTLAARLDTSYEGLSDEWRPLKGSNKNRRATHARGHVKAADRLVQRLEAQAVEVPTPPLAFVLPDLPSLPKGYTSGPLLELRAPRVHGALRGDGGISADGGSGADGGISADGGSGADGGISADGGSGADGASGGTGGDGVRVRLDLPGTRIDVPPCGRLLVTGPNGSGKSTVLAALAGTLGLDRGSRKAVAGLRLGVLAQEGVTALHPGSHATGFELCARRALDLLAAGELDPDQIVPVASLGLLTEEDLDRPVAELSVGQRRRLDLALALVAAPHVLLLDEPTNHLSVGLVDELTAALRVTSAAVVVATHDRRMRNDLADWPELQLG